MQRCEWANDLRGMVYDFTRETKRQLRDPLGCPTDRHVLRMSLAKKCHYLVRLRIVPPLAWSSQSIAQLEAPRPYRAVCNLRRHQPHETAKAGMHPGVAGLR